MSYHANTYLCFTEELSRDHVKMYIPLSQLLIEHVEMYISPNKLLSKHVNTYYVTKRAHTLLI